MFILQPWHLLVVAIGSWINRHQQMMIGWLKAKYSAWAKRVLLQEIDRLKEDARILKAEKLRIYDDKPMQLSPEEKKRLRELRKRVNPERLIEHTLFHF